MHGLKENIILGQLIPAGTGLRRYQDMLVKSEAGNIFGQEAIVPDAVAEESSPIIPVKRTAKKA
jgi:hypothetical protein